MLQFFILLKRFLPSYKKYVFLTVFLNLLSTLFSLFSFAAIIPVLNILFGASEAKTQYVNWEYGDGLNAVIEGTVNNIKYGVEQLIITHGAQTALLLIGIFLVVMTLLKTCSAYFSGYFVIPIRTGVLRDLRNRLYNKVLSLPLGYYTDERKGDLMSRMTSDVSEVENSIISSLNFIFKNPITILAYLAVMLVISWQLTIFVLILLPFSGFMIGKISSSLRRTSREGQAQHGEFLSQLEETLSGLRIIKAFNAEAKMKTRFNALNETLRRTFNRINRRFELAHPLSEFIGTVVIAILLWFGGTLILHHNSPIDAASFIYYLVIFYSIINPAKDLSRGAYAIQKGMASLERVDNILNTVNTITDPSAPEKCGDFADKIEYKNVWFKYENDWILQDINLCIPKGKTVALVGQSGSGKSTLVDLLPRFYDVQKGDIFIDNINIKSVTMNDLRAKMGNVNQEAILFNDTFFNNIAFGVEKATFEQVEQAAKIANAHDFIVATEKGYYSTIGDRGSKLSGGQRQRLSIARAILKNPPILILDEATSALDTESEKLVQEALENLMRNRTTLVVAHRLSTIKRADEICVMNEGKIVERGTHENLIALNGYYKKLCDMQAF
ncbi:MAG: ABC transporter ATP-binding protein/permease [Prevotellaceae bacterium]|jgi:ABC-type multidrug transport system fused ATPase/permease subunit|nr:ABC transporter ATP-binding protein/permease [Prevotellaceae bacterium]